MHSRLEELMTRTFLRRNLANVNDIATCHIAQEIQTLLQTKLPGRIISQRSDIDWPPRSQDLTPSDFFLWSYLEERVYVNKTVTIPELKGNLRCVLISYLTLIRK